MFRTSQQIRREFLEFFQQRGHTVVPSSSLLPADAPTLLFTNAGMNQFKDVFLGAGRRPFSRAVDSQKCIRAGGKHNDLEDVGRDTYHQTFFEMLGNWSFGDYFKAEAIAWAWELLTKVWGIPKERLYATIFGGDAAAGLEEDREAAGLWSKATDIDPAHVLRGSMADNFWEMGDTGPCGPSSEIHIDLGSRCCDGSRHAGAACAVNVAGCSRFVELWNLVFIQFNRDESGKLSKLPANHVDTGMGLERVVAVLQGKTSNYDTDVFTPLIGWLEDRSGQRYGQDKELDVAFRVVADHARACTFAIADGVLPSNEGRGYVIRRILRRAARYGRKLVQAEPFLHKLTDVVVAQLGQAYPEIELRKSQVARTIHEEEMSFNRTLDRGLTEFEATVSWLVPLYIEEQVPNVIMEESAAGSFRVTIPASKGQERVIEVASKGDLTPLFDKLGIRKPQLPGLKAFELYATYGFPVDLTQLMAAERGLAVDMEGYQREMERHRQISSAGGGAFQAAAVVGLPETDDSAKCLDEPVQAKVLGWVIGQEYQAGGQLGQGAEAAVVLEETNFYGESGGQVGDQGRLTGPTGSFVVRDTKLAGHCVLHLGVVEQGTLSVGQVVRAEVSPLRADTRRNHTATHLLNWALRTVLGEHVEQAGSVVAPDRLRFDFAHSQAMTPEQLVQVEKLVNERVLADEPVYVKALPLAEARKIPGVRAVFGEKYPDPVRVMSIGAADPLSQPKVGTPVEFCGGTHLARTSQVGLFKLVSEESVAKGVRRITAITGHAAVAHVQRLDQVVRAASAALRVPDEQIVPRLEAIQAEIRQLRKQKSAAATSGGGLDGLLAAAEQVGPARLIVGELDVQEPEQLRSAVDQLRQKAGGPAAVMIGSRAGDRVTLIAGLSDELVESTGLKAGDWVKTAAAIVGGSGGGKPNMAQAGGKDGAKLPEALEAARQWARQKLAAK